MGRRRAKREPRPERRDPYARHSLGAPWPVWLPASPEHEYDVRMQKARVTVSVRPEVLAKATRQVKQGKARSISAWVDAAMDEKARREDLATLLAEMRAEAGPATPEEEAWAKSVLGQ